MMNLPECIHASATEQCLSHCCVHSTSPDQWTSMGYPLHIKPSCWYVNVESCKFLYLGGHGVTATSTGRGGMLWTVKQGTLTSILLTYHSQGLRNVLPKKSASRLHSVALQEDLHYCKLHCRYTFEVSELYRSTREKVSLWLWPGKHCVLLLGSPRTQWNAKEELVRKERDKVRKAGKRASETRARAGFAQARTESNMYGKHERFWNFWLTDYTQAGTQPSTYGKNESFWNISTDFTQATAG